MRILINYKVYWDDDVQITNDCWRVCDEVIINDPIQGKLPLSLKSMNPIMFDWIKTSIEANETERKVYF
jgi:hypothetical protein